MNPDIQNFSDVLAINTADQLCLDIHLAAEGKYRLTVNGQEITDKISQTHWDLLTPIEIQIKNLSLNATILIEKISINDLEILPHLGHLSSNQSHAITKPGRWSFSIPDPFYIWYHNVMGYGMVA